MVFSFHKSTLVIALTAASVGFFAPAAVKATDATMYYDCCKPSGSWMGKAPVYNPVATCLADGKTIVTGPKRDDPNSSGCGGGNEFQCSCQQPWTDAVNPTVGYAFAAMTSTTESENECACYVATFSGAKSGKINTLFYQVINDGGDVTSDGLDILVPGMGVGAMTQGCKNQWPNSDISKWGKQYGGLDRDAAGCKNLPEDLQHGCMWRMTDWGDSVTMQGKPQRVRCSKGHIDRTGCQRKDEPSTTFQGHYDSAHNGPAPDGYTPNPAVCNIGAGGNSKRTVSSNGQPFVARRHHQAHPVASRHASQASTCPV
ncbi:related to Endoglucanase 1 precursor [Sporisorium reilianum SRZ2]|uniref:cellulase n=1 Tax=Sporisorium reilianum (strain SRZ2) TaxID=999809 RepID=E7A084_SPORE|nr:related to Endoglucanase 1 precursor [Sporisorium reilianum SRZ2]